MRRLARALLAAVKAFRAGWRDDGQVHPGSEPVAGTFARARVVRQSGDLTSIDVDVFDPPIGFVADVAVVLGFPARVRLAPGDPVFIRWWTAEAPEAMVAPIERPMTLSILPPGAPVPEPTRGPAQ